MEPDPTTEPSSSRFSIGLTFAAATCPNCEEPRIAGTCEECGAEIPAVEEVDELTLARQSALTPIAEDVRALVASVADVPDPQIEVGVDQFVACVEDLEIIDRSGRMVRLGHVLGALDLDDPKQIGGAVRTAVVNHVELVRELQADAFELARFEIRGPGSELRDLGIEAARWGADVIDVLLRALTTSDPREAQAAASRFQEMIDSFDFYTRMDELTPAIDQWAIPDDNARIALVVGKEGEYTDEFGFIDFQSVLASFAEADAPFEQLADAATRYVVSVIGPETVGQDEAHALLILPAVSIATLDHPLLAHRICRQLIDLMTRAWGADPAAVKRCFARAIDETPRVLAAAGRTQSAFRLLHIGGETVDTETTMATALNAYKSLAETSYRVLGVMALELSAIVASSSKAWPETPTVGALRTDLIAQAEGAARELGASCDAPLRNAIAHEQYRWEDADEQIRDLKTGQVWSSSELENTINALVGAVAGADAALACFVFTSNIDLTPSWASDGSVPDASLFAAMLNFAPGGLEVIATQDGGATVVIEPPDSIDPVRALSGFAGMAVIAPHANTLRLVDPTGKRLLSVDTQALRSASEADPVVKDLATVEAVLNAVLHSGRDPLAAISDVAIFLAKVVGVTAMQSLAESGPTTETLEIMRTRFSHLAALADTAPTSSRDLDRLKDKLGRALESAALADEDQAAFLRMVDQISAIVTWADKHFPVWPPVLGATSD